MSSKMRAEWAEMNKRVCLDCVPKFLERLSEVKKKKKRGRVSKEKKSEKTLR